MDLHAVVAKLPDGALDIAYADGSYLITRLSGLPCQVTASYDSELYAALEAYRGLNPAAVPVIEASAGPTVVELAKIKASEIQAAKIAIRDGGFLVDGILFDSDQAARLAYGEFADILRDDPACTTRWRASTDAWVTMDAALYATVRAAGTAHVQAAFAWQEAQDAKLAGILAGVAAGTMPEADARTAVAAVSTVYGAD